MVFRVGLYPTGGHHRAKALGNADVPVIPGRDLRHGVLRGAGVAFGGAGLRRFLVGEQLAVLHHHAAQPLPAGNLGGIIQQRFVRPVTKAGEQNNQLFLVLHHFTSTT